MSLPAGTVTFLFTDIEGSTRLLDGLGPEAYAEALSTHRRALRGAFAAHGGVEVERQGDSFFFAFARAGDAVAAALASQAALGGGPISVRMGLHTGLPILAAEGYVGMDVHRAARIAAVAHGGQVLLSDATRQLVDGIDVRDLGLHRLKDLDEPLRLFQLGDREFSPLKSLYRANLPAQTTQLIGRDDALDSLCELIERPDVRLVTLTGPGGIGKTRLALASAERVARSFPDGVHWIALQALRDTELVLPTIAQALETNDVAAAVGNGAVLLVLDNFEQVVDAATVVSDLLTACPHLAILVTSREPLHVRAEHEWPVPPLAEEAAVELFAERAQAVRPEFSPGEEADAICGRLDGLPLAIELAAAHVRSLSPGAMLERFERRLDLLGAGPRDLPERHRTLRATIDWSYELLTPAEQGLFARLAVFAGGCTPVAAETVCDTDLNTLEALVEKSLLRESNGRFWMLETIREFARERLKESDENEAVRKRHADFFVALAAQAEQGWRGPEQPAWGDRLDAEQNNLRAALAWLDEIGDTDAVLALVVGMASFWTTHGSWREGSRWLDPALARTRGERTGVRAKALRAGSMFADPLGDLESSSEYNEESLAISRELGDPAELGRALSALGVSTMMLGDVERSHALFDEAALHLRGSGQHFNLALVLANQANLLLEEDPARAESLLEEAVALHREIGTEHGLPHCLYTLAFLRFRAGREREAETGAREAVVLCHGIGDVRYAVLSLFLVGSIEARRGDPDVAARLLGAAEAERARIGLSLDPSPGEELEMSANALAETRAALAPAAFQAASDEGSALTLDEAVKLAVERRSGAVQPA